MRLLRRVHRPRMRRLEPPFPFRFRFLTDDLITLGCVTMSMADLGLTDLGLAMTDRGLTDLGLTDWGLRIVSARSFNMSMIAADFLLYSGGWFFEFVHTK